MVGIINGTNGKVAILSITILGIGILSLIGYGMALNYEPSFDLKNGIFTLSKATGITA